jgi:signal transduction histidine kinase
MGLGIIGAQRLMDEVRVDTAAGRGTRVRLAKSLPATHPAFTRSALVPLVEALEREGRASPIEELQVQNRELVQALAQLHQRQEELVRLNRELEDTNRGVVALYAELDARAEDLKRAAKLKSRFLSNVSHELRTPLQSTLGLTRLLLDGADGELAVEQRKQVDFIRCNAEGLLEMVSDLLDLAKIEAGATDVQITEVQVANVFSALRGMMRPLLSEDSVALVFEDAVEVPLMYTDEGKISQILRNFISNAIKFTPRGEVRVTARLNEAEDCVVFSVSDTGVGIGDQDHERIFEEFVQLRNPLQARASGTGLGLPLTRRLAKVLRGRVEMSSEQEKGSVFRAIIPRDYDAAVIAPEPAKSKASLPLQREAQPRVLLVDDDEAARYVLRKLLAARPCQAFETSDGASGVQQAISLQPDVIFLDLNMPGMSGREALRQLRADARTRSIPVVIVTGQPLSPVERTSFQGKADAVISKSDLSSTSVRRILHDLLGKEEVRP